MTAEMKKALELLRGCGRMTRVKEGRTDWLPDGEIPEWEIREKWCSWDARLQNKTRTQTASIGRLVDAGWAEYEKGKNAVKYIDRDAPLHDAICKIDKLKALVREMRVCLNRNMPVTDRLWAESIELLADAQKGREG